MKKSDETTGIVALSLGAVGIGLLDDVSVALGIGAQNEPIKNIATGAIFAIVVTLILLILFKLEKFNLMKRVGLSVGLITTSFTIGILSSKFLFIGLKTMKLMSFTEVAFVTVGQMFEIIIALSIVSLVTANFILRRK